MPVAQQRLQGIGTKLNLTLPYISAHSEFAQPPRSLHEFKRPQEVLRAVRDAITAHAQHYMTTSEIHGGVGVDSIYIGAPPTNPHAHGFLMEPEACTADATFQSVRALSDALGRKQVFPLDYLDDLESFYYVLAWMCYAYDCDGDGSSSDDPEGSDSGESSNTSPHLISIHQRADALTCWATNPLSRESILEKEGMLFGTGIRYSGAPVSAFWGGEAYHTLLDNLHFVVGSRYREKTELGCPRTWEELKCDAQVDYEAFIGIINTMLYQLERTVWAT